MFPVTQHFLASFIYFNVQNLTKLPDITRFGFVVLKTNTENLKGCIRLLLREWTVDVTERVVYENVIYGMDSKLGEFEGICNLFFSCVRRNVLKYDRR